MNLPEFDQLIVGTKKNPNKSKYSLEEIQEIFPHLSEVAHKRSILESQQVESYHLVMLQFKYYRVKNHLNAELFKTPQNRGEQDSSEFLLQHGNSKIT
jgi:hypothetical protein